jgi:uncharacterized protein YjdB
VTFTSSSPQVATVSGSGLVTGIAPGSATITATSGSASGSAAVTVSAVPVASVSISPSPASVIVGHQIQLSATPLSATGQPLTGRSVSWTSGAPGLASVSSTGVVTGLAVGDAVILATVEGIVGSVTVTVMPEPIASVTVSPPSASILVGQTLTLSAIVLDGSGNTVTGAAIAWSTSDGAVATVSSGGVVTGVAAGSATITATSGGVSGSATVTVTQPPVDHVVVTPHDPSANAGVLVQFTATLYDAQNNVLTGRPVTWSTSDPTIVAVDATGLAVGLRKGTATITATSEGKSGSTKMTVK